MVSKPDTFDEVLAHWPTPAALSADLGIPYVTAQVMRHRRSVGDTHWAKLIECMAAKGIVLTTDDLLAMKFRRKEEKQRQRSVAA